MSNTHIDFQGFLKEIENIDFQRLICALESSLEKIGFNKLPTIQRNMSPGGSLTYRVQFENQNTNRSIDLCYFPTPKRLALYLKNGSRFVAWKDILNHEYSSRTEYPQKSDQSVNAYNEMQISGFLAHLNDPLILDILQGKSWKEYPIDWGPEKQ
jgi:hypothetical protein